MFVVEPPGALWFGHGWKSQGSPLSEGYSYTSDSNDEWMTVDSIREMIAPYDDRG